MTEIVVVSDTHGNAKKIQDMLSVLKTISFDEIFHLGDDYKDADAFVEAGYVLTRVPGTWTSEYESIYIDNRCFVDCLGWRIFLTHTPESHYRDLVGDIKPERVIQKKDCDLFLHGHTHRPAIEERGGLTVLNPGHLKADIDRGYPATYATISLSNLQAHIKVFKLIDGSVLLEKTIDKRTSK